MRLQVHVQRVTPSLLSFLFLFSTLFAQSELSTSVTALDFGSVTVGKTGGHKLTLINSGGGSAIDVTALNFGGAHAGDFDIVSKALPFSIPNGDTLNVIVEFSPGWTGTKDGSLTVVNNGIGGNPVIMLTGEGCEIQANPAPDPNAPTLEQDGKLVIEFESQDPPAGQGWTWSELTENPAIYSDGDTVFEDVTFLKSNLSYTVDGGGGAFGTLCYKVQITNPGIYRFKMLSKQGETIRDTTKIDSAYYPAFDPPTPPATNEENDIWVRVPNPAANVLAVAGNDQNFDSVAVVGNDWFKVFQGDIGWTDNTVTIDEVGLLVYFEFTEVDTFSICFSVRSKNFSVDKFALYNINQAFINVEDPSVPVSPAAIPCPDGFWWYDNDGDGFGDAAFKYSAQAQPIGFSANAEDCDDSNVNANPSLSETLDGVDNNCNTYVDEGFAEAVGPCQERRFNAGYESTINYVAGSGLEYEPDNTILVSNSAKNTVPDLAIANTTEDGLYQTIRTGTLSKPIQYEIPVTNGGYDIVLHFAEIYQGVISDTAFVGQKIFHVLVEGDTVLKNFDIYAEADSQATAAIKLVSATVTDGLMNLDLVAVNDGPAISAFELFPQAGCGETATLPVELLSFEARKQDGVVALSWETAMEQNNDFFTIERSADARTFVGLGQVNSQGNSQAVQAYQFTDAQPLKGSNYYRLKQTDIDGSFSYSSVVEVVNSSYQIEVFPNPLQRNGQLNIQVESQKATSLRIQLLNLMGQVLIDQQATADAGNSTHQLDLANISQGYYLVAIETPFERVVRKVMVVD